MNPNASKVIMSESLIQAIYHKMIVEQIKMEKDILELAMEESTHLEDDPQQTQKYKI